MAVILVGSGALLAYGAFLATQEPADAFPPGDVAVASKGEAFEVTAYLAQGKYTIFDFYADWCAPCRVLDPQLRKLVSERDDVALRKVDIVDWSSAVVKQFGFTSLPHVQVYDPDGRLMAEGQEAFRLLEDLFDTRVF